MVVVDFEKDYYAILGLENTATLDEIKKTYRVLAKQYHPDVNKAPNATEIFNAISESYEILSDERQRAEYDEHSVHGAPKQNVGSKRAKASGGVSTGQGQEGEAGLTDGRKAGADAAVVADRARRVPACQRRPENRRAAAGL